VSEPDKQDGVKALSDLCVAEPDGLPRSAPRARIRPPRAARMAVSSNDDGLPGRFRLPLEKQLPARFRGGDG
jgi:hypothetical protein